MSDNISRRGLAAFGTTILFGGASLAIAAPASAATYDLGPSTLYRGKRGTYVRNLQTALNDLIGARLKVDGSFGSGTDTAVRNFQRSRKLTVDGRVGAATKAAINSGAKAAAPAPAEGPWKPQAGMLGPVTALAPVTGGVPIKDGWNGTRVRILQKKLGIHRTGPRQTYDQETRNAVIAFQKRNGLTANGVVDRKTWDKLGTGYPFDMDAWRTSIEVPAGATRTQRIDKMCQFAERQVGTPYTWGGAGYRNPWTAGFDCSGLVLQAMYAAGLDPQPINVIKHAEPTYRTSQQLYAHKGLKSVPLAERRRGDLIFYSRTQNGPVTHVTLYLGNERMVESWSTDTHRLNYSSRPHGGYYYVKPTIKRPFA